MRAICGIWAWMWQAGLRVGQTEAWFRSSEGWNAWGKFARIGTMGKMQMEEKYERIESQCATLRHCIG
jgi:hypothetical protein